MRLLVCGDRNWDNYDRVKKYIMKINRESPIEVLIEGGQVSNDGQRADHRYGADYQAKMAAMELGIPVMEFPPNWNYYNRAAGPIRNGHMLQYGKPDLVLAFHQAINTSKGTKNMVEQAKRKGVKVKIIK